MAARSLHTWAVGLGSVVRFCELTDLPPMSLPAEARVPSWVQDMKLAEEPTVPEFTKNVACAL